MMVVVLSTVIVYNNMKREFYVSDEVAIQLRQKGFPQEESDIRLDDGTAVPSYMEVHEWFRLKGICIDINSSWFTDEKMWDCTTNYTESDGTVVSLYSGIWVTPNMAMENIIKKILNYDE